MILKRVLSVIIFLTCIAHIYCQIDSVVVEIEDAVVTGERGVSEASNAIRVIKVIDADDIQNSASQNLSELLRSQLNFRISNDLVLGGGLSINGLGGNNIKIMVNGVPIVGRLNGEIDLTQIQIDQYDRIEIVEGPLAVEYGTNSLAGTINLITDLKHQDQISSDCKFRYESVGAFAQSAKINASKNNSKSSLSISRNYFDGWNDGDEQWDWINDYYADSSRVNSWNPKVQNQVSFTEQYLFDNSMINARIEFNQESIENKGYPRLPFGEAAFDDEYNTSRLISSLNYKEYQDANLKWDIVSSFQKYRRTKFSYVTDLTSLEQTLQGPNEQDTTEFINLMSRGNRYFDFNKNLSLNLGWDAFHEKFSGKRMTTPKQSQFDIAAFSVIEYDSKNTKFQVGLRQAFNSNTPETVYSPSVIKLGRTIVLPSFNSLFKFSKHRIRLSYAKGFRSPTLKELHFMFVDINHDIYGNENLTPETSNYFQTNWSYIGEFNGTLRLFYNNVQNQIGLVDQLDGTFRYENFDSFLSHGSEIRLSDTFKNFKIDFSGSYVGRMNNYGRSYKSGDWYVDRELRVSMPVIIYEPDSSYTYTPEFSLSITHDIIPERLSYWGSIKYNGARERLISNGDGDIMSLIADPYSLLDASITYTSNEAKYIFQFGARNILNVTNVQTSQQQSAHSGSSSWIAWGRSYVISLSINLNKVK